MKAVIIDTETTGLDPSVDHCIEVACILYDLSIGTTIASYSSLIHSETNAAEAINRIPVAALLEARPAEHVWDRVQGLAERADVILAHRAEFDRGFVPESAAAGAPWCCTKFHVDWPLGKPGDHLVHLALAHGIGVLDAHRALTDCQTIARILTRVHEMAADDAEPEPLVRLIQRAMRPRKKIVAMVSYDDREKAKSAGFAWDPATRTWWREMPEDEIASLPFPTRAA